MQLHRLAAQSTGKSAIHSADPRIKLIWLLGFVIVLSLCDSPSLRQLGCAFALILVTVQCSRQGILRLLFRSLCTLPFVGPFAAVLYLSGDPARAWSILSKSYLTISAVYLTVATTTFPSLLSAARWLKVPVMLVEITQLIHRYFFVLGEQAREMQFAFKARGGSWGRQSFTASAGIVAILFIRTYERSQFTYRAMLARGYDGVLPRQPFRTLNGKDALVLSAGLLAIGSIYLL